MAKLKVADMTAEQLEARHTKAKERREARKDANIEAINEIVALLTEKQLQSLSKEAQHFISRMRGELAVVRNIYTPVEGDTLAAIFAQYPNISSKKLEAKCKDAGLKIDWAKAQIVKA